MSLIVDFFKYLAENFFGLYSLLGFGCFMFFLLIRHSKRFSLENRIRLNFLYKLFVYSSEILLMFLIFKLLLISPLKNYLGYSSEGILKQFIDFFTIYQIFIFIVLNMYDSVQKEIHLTLLHKIDFFQPYLDENKTIKNEIIELERHFSNERFLQYDEIDISDHDDYREFLSYLKQYDVNKKDAVAEKNEIIFKINLLKNEVIEKKERLDSLWKPSLFLRFFASKLFNKLLKKPQ